MHKSTTPTPGEDPLAGIDVPRIRVEGAIVDALGALGTVGDRTEGLDPPGVTRSTKRSRRPPIPWSRRCAGVGGTGGDIVAPVAPTRTGPYRSGPSPGTGPQGPAGP
jgi:hypothetical protein